MDTSTQPNRPGQKHSKPVLIDVLVASMLAVVSILLSIITFGYLDPVLYGLLGIDFWFQSDMTRVFYNMTGVESSHYRASVHPLFSLIAFYGAIIVEQGAGIFRTLTDEQSAQLFIAGVAGVWAATLYTLLRLLSLPRLDAFLFSLLGVFSAAFFFWFSVPETYSFGSVSILLPLVAAALNQRSSLAEGWFVAASSVSLSVTITNWMAGLGAAFFSLRFGRAFRVSLAAAVIVSLLWLLEKKIFPATGSLLNNSGELNYIFREETGGPLHILISFLSSTIVMPEVQLIGKLDRPDWLILSVQHSLPWQGGIITLAASCGWLALFSLGLWQLLFGNTAGRIRLLVGALLAGQLVLHLIYGEETFLYSLHFLPLLIVTAALASKSRYRRFVLGLVTAVMIVAGINNMIRFREARQLMMQQFYPDRTAGYLLETELKPAAGAAPLIFDGRALIEWPPEQDSRPALPSVAGYGQGRRG